MLTSNQTVDQVPKLVSLDHLVLTVSSIQRTTDFYRGVLGMDVDVFQPADGSTRTAVTFGTQKINLHQSGSEFAPKAHAPAPGTADLCFLSDAPVMEWVAHLDALGIPIEEGPIERTGATGPILSVYIRDPDGNLIEIANRI